jgi:succinoglycan biosynthesis protein ExoA
VIAPRLLVVIPCVNEAAHLPSLLDGLCADPAAATARIVVADGGSTDGSADIVRERGKADARVTLLPNPQRIQSAGVNLAARTFGAEADLLVRVDAHAGYSADFLTQLVAAQTETGADSVTVAMRAAANTGDCFQRAVAAAQNSLLGAGGSPHRKAGERRWVDHGHHALFKLASFRAAGGYDESFTHNEDAEFDARLARNGGRVLLAADIVIDYFPRSTARGLARQYFMHGRGRARTTVKHRLPLKPRQLAPISIAPAVALALLTPLTAWAAAPTAVWLGACLIYGLWLGLRDRDACAATAGIPAAIMHFAWSLGFLREWLSATRGQPARAAEIEQKQA